MERKRNPGPAVPHSAEPVLGLAEGKTRGFNPGYSLPDMTSGSEITTEFVLNAPGSQMEGTNDEARTGEVWLTGGDVNADADSTVIADLAGTASNATTTLPFTATITIGTANRGIPGSDPSQPTQHPICKQRIVSPIPIDLRPHDGGTLVLAIDPRTWFANVDFTALVPGGGGGFVFPDTNTNAASQNLFTGLRAASSTFQLSFE